MASVDITADVTGLRRKVRQAEGDLRRFRTGASKGFRQLNHDLRASEQGFNKIGRALGRTNPLLGEMVTQLGAVKGAAGAAVLGVGAITAAVGALGIAGGKAFSTLEDKIFNFARLTEDIPYWMQEGTRLANELSRTLAVDSGSVGDALYQAFSAGATDLVGAAQAGLEYGAITGISPQLTTAAFINLGKQGYNPREAANLVLDAEIQMQATPEAMTQVFGQLIPLAFTKGMSMPELFAALDALTSVGSTASVAATQMVQLIETLSDPGKEAGEFFEKTFGKPFQEIAPEIDFLEILKQLTTAAGGQRETELLFGRKEARLAYGVLMAVQQEYYESEERFRVKSTATLDQVLAEREKLVSTSWKRLSTEIKASLVEVGQAVAPSLKALADAMADIFKSEYTQIAIELAAALSKNLFTAMVGLMRGLEYVVQNIVDFFAILVITFTDIVNGVIEGINSMIKAFNAIPVVPNLPTIPHWEHNLSITDYLHPQQRTTGAPPAPPELGGLPEEPAALAQAVEGALPQEIKDLVSALPTYESEQDLLNRQISELQDFLHASGAAVAFGGSPLPQAELQSVRDALMEANRRLTAIQDSASNIDTNTQPETKEALFTYAPLSLATRDDV